jgi:hypothetical protein
VIKELTAEQALEVLMAGELLGAPGPNLATLTTRASTTTSTVSWS